MVLKIKTITNEIYAIEINETEVSFKDFMNNYVMNDGYLKVKDIIKRTTWINSKHIESVTIMEDKQND